MANTFTDKYKKRLPAPGDLNWADENNEDHLISEILGAARDQNNRTLWGLAASDGGGLSVDYAAGRAEVGGSIFEIAAGSKTAVDDASDRSVNYLYVDSSGVVQISQTAPTGQYAPIAMIDVASGAIDRIGDFRQIPSGLLADETLAEINKIIDTTANIVDVFLYDTSKDSDGGAWRERTEYTSWYNETLDTATRGGTRKFPAIAFIVAESDTVTLYDATDTSLPMWMEIQRSTNFLIDTGASLSSIIALNGELSIGGAETGGGGLFRINFVKDTGYRYRLSGTTGSFNSNLADRNTTADYAYNGSDFIVDGIVNDVAMTVLPNAPVDQATGLPIPTIAVATDGGVSVITDSGDVWDIVGSTGNSWKNLTFIDTRIAAFHQNAKDVVLLEIPTADYNYQTGGDDNTYNETTIPAIYETNDFGSKNISFLSNGSTGSIAISKIETGNIGTGLTLLREDPATPANGMVNYITSDYQSGWMHGDIKGAWLADTDDTDATGAELVTNVTFDTDTDWTKGDGWTIGAGVASSDGTQTANSDLVNIGTGVEGETYTITLDITAYTAGNITPIIGGNFSSSLSATGSYALTIKAGAGGSILIRAGSTFIGSIDNVSVRLTDIDRSVNDNGLQVFGTITKTAVATGAELVDYSGFSASNYLEQPYNSDLDFGTGDFYIMGWFKHSAQTARKFMLHRQDIGVSGAGIRIRLGSGSVIETLAGVTGPTSVNEYDDDNYHFVVLKRSGTTAILDIDGGSEIINLANSSDLDNSTAITRIGIYVGGLSEPFDDGSLALWRAGAGAPTAEQIKHIYNTEKHLFQENAACTLSGTSDAVAALAHDDVKDLLYVGTGDGVSVFSGLNRVDYIDTTGIPTSDAVVALSASGGAYVIGNAAEAVGYIPAANLREEITRQEATGEVLEVFWFTSDTVFEMAPGWKPKFVYGAGLLVEEGVYYDTTFDGFLYTVTLTGAAAAVAIMGVKA